MSVLVTLGLGLLSLSLVAVGGAVAVMPEVHRLVVDQNGWMTDSTFSQLFALAQAAPGPNVLAISLIGWEIAGPAGLLVSTVAVLGPTCLLAYGFALMRERLKGSIWIEAIARGLVPLAIGLMLATGIVLTEASSSGWPSYAVAAVSTLVCWRSKLSPLWMLVAGAAVGAVAL